MIIRLELEVCIEPLSSREISEILTSGLEEKSKSLKSEPKNENSKSLKSKPKQDEVTSTASTGQQRKRNLSSFFNLQCFSGSQFSRAQAQSPGQLSSSSDLKRVTSEDKIDHLRKSIETLEIQVEALRTAHKNPTNARVLRESKAELEDKRKKLKEMETKHNLKKYVSKTESRGKLSTAEDLRKSIEKLEIQINALRTAHKNPTNARVLRESKAELEEKMKRLKKLELNASK